MRSDGKLLFGQLQVCSSELDGSPHHEREPSGRHWFPARLWLKPSPLVLSLLHLALKPSSFPCIDELSLAQVGGQLTKVHPALLKIHSGLLSWKWVAPSEHGHPFEALQLLGKLILCWDKFKALQEAMPST